MCLHMVLVLRVLMFLFWGDFLVVYKQMHTLLTSSTVCNGHLDHPLDYRGYLFCESSMDLMVHGLAVSW
jgi:hypothetical protein